ncbi:MAG: Sapep family Mn(2+)-dependent dipeptidase [Clostridia bacterium]|nr:Sapep family Mn(2+)-dependent dipeptidase [Clostridia bacterium]
MYEKEIERFAEDHIDELLDDLKALIRTDSSRTDALPGMPYGEGPAKALAQGEELFHKYGFKCARYDGRAIAADISDLPAGLDILAHLDVVPGGTGWTVTEPFEPVVRDGKIYGRGSSDDKGPALAALYAMRAVKELGIPLKSNVRLILGGDEECGSSDIEYYFEREPHAPMTVSPDADYPVIHAERGLTDVTFSAEAETGEILSFTSGEKFNMIPASACFTVKGADAGEIDAASEKLGIPVKVETAPVPGGVKVTVTGEGGHSSTPDLARNALTASLALISALPLSGETANLLKGLSRMFPFGDHHGGAAGIDMSDPESGRITASLNMLNMKDGRLTGVVDCRVPVCATEDNCAGVLRSGFEGIGFTVDDCLITPVHNVPSDSHFVKTLIGCYEKITGCSGEPLAIGGGTYCHDIPNGVAFGCAVPGVDNRMHGPDEFMLVSVLKDSVRIYADAIVELCGAAE